MEHAITLHLPNPLYQRYRERARNAHRDVETELMEVVTAAAADEEVLPADLEEALEELSRRADEELWRVARERLPAEVSAAIEQLNAKQRDQGLEARERARLDELLHQHEKTMLLRAEAAKLLHERGHDVSSLLA